jgi:PIN domain nuclease of toxin-antitoxin system
MLLLDTHVVHWMAVDAARIGASTRQMLDQTDASSLVVSVITLWELGLLIQRAKLRPPLTIDVEDFAGQLSANQHPILPLDVKTVLAAGQLQGLHADPADRFLVATAQVHKLRLVTADRKILAWQGSLGRLDAST